MIGLVYMYSVYFCQKGSLYPHIIFLAKTFLEGKIFIHIHNMGFYVYFPGKPVETKVRTLNWLPISLLLLEDAENCFVVVVRLQREKVGWQGIAIAIDID